MVTPLALLRTHLATICARCPRSRITTEGRLVCGAMNDLPVVPLIARGWPFCPLWYHTFGVPKRQRIVYSSRWLFSAAIKAVASRLRICQADADTIAARRATCDGCDKRDGTKCGACGCPIENKTALATERCPLDPPKWSLAMNRWCNVLTRMERRGILLSGPAPAWFARITSARPWGGSAPGCAGCDAAKAAETTVDPPAPPENAHVD